MKFAVFARYSSSCALCSKNTLLYGNVNVTSRFSNTGKLHWNADIIHIDSSFAQATNKPRLLGRTQYICDKCLFVPKYEVWNGSLTEVLYRIRPDTCVGGMCPKCICGGEKGRCCAMPFFIRRPKPPFEPVPAEDGTDAQIINLWSGKKECCMRQNYGLKFPKDATPDTRATLVGSTLLVEMLHFEQN